MRGVIVINPAHAGATRDPPGLELQLQMEVAMNPVTPIEHTTTLGFNAIRWAGTDALPRDREQSHRLHEPEYLMNTIDPITGADIHDPASHPYIEDGNLTIYFESELTQKVYQNTPINHPVEKLPVAPSEDDDRGG